MSETTEAEALVEALVAAWPVSTGPSGPVLYRQGDGSFWFETPQGSRWPHGPCGPFATRREAVLAVPEAHRLSREYHSRIATESRKALTDRLVARARKERARGGN